MSTSVSGALVRHPNLAIKTNKFSTSSTVLFLLAVLALPHNAACANDTAGTEKSLPTVVVTASRAPRTLGEEIADISVIPREEIDRAGQQTLADLLQQQAGIEIGRNGGAASTTSVFMRGTNSNHVIVLVDGVRINSATSGGASWSALPLTQIDRVEILRGPASGLYGADAIGGVIQIFTRQGQAGFKGEIAAGVGSNQLDQQSVNLRGGTDQLNYSLTLGQEASRGFNAKPALAADADRDGYRAKNIGANVKLALNQDHNLGLLVLQNRLTSQFDSGTAFDNRAVQYADVYALTSNNRFNQHWQSTLRLAESRDKYSDMTNYGFGAGTSRINTRQQQATWQNDLTLGNQALQLSAESRDEKLDADVNYDKIRRRTHSLIGLYQTTLGAHSMQLNLRNDDSNQYGSKTTGGAGYGYRFTPQWRVTVSAATAFHAPTFNDLYYPGFSNPDLKPETARNLESALHYQQGSHSASVTVYRNRIRDMIASTSTTVVNINRAKLEGVTLQGATQFGKLQLSASMDYLNAHDETTGKWLPRRAREHAALKALYQIHSATFGGEWLVSGHRFDDTANTNRLHGYGVLNLISTWKIAKDWELLARWNNVFDQHYQLVKDYQTPRSNGFLGVRYQFGK